MNIEDLPPVVCFFRHQQIEQERGQATLLQHPGHGIVARTEPPAAAPMREKNHTQGLAGKAQRALEQERPLGDADRLLVR